MRLARKTPSIGFSVEPAKLLWPGCLATPSLPISSFRCPRVAGPAGAPAPAIASET